MLFYLSGKDFIACHGTMEHTASHFLKSGKRPERRRYRYPGLSISPVAHMLGSKLYLLGTRQWSDASRSANAAAFRLVRNVLRQGLALVSASPVSENPV